MSSIFTQELADLICGEIASGRSLRSVCQDEGMPTATSVFRWLAKHEAFSEQYARAMEARTNALAEEIIDIADEGARDTYIDDNGNERTNNDVIARSRLRVDTRKWLMSKMAPKKYGEKLDIKADVDAHLTINVLPRANHKPTA